MYNIIYIIIYISKYSSTEQPKQTLTLILSSENRAQSTTESATGIYTYKNSLTKANIK